VTVRIGWARTDERKPGRIAAGVHVFEFLKLVNNERGRHVVVGTLHYNRADLEQLRTKEQTLDVRVIGRLRFADDVTPALVAATIDQVHVSGWLRASPDVKRAVTR
jgi:hypothetical protein